MRRLLYKLLWFFYRITGQEDKQTDKAIINELKKL